MISVDDYIEAFRVLLPDLHKNKAAALRVLAMYRNSGIAARQVAKIVGGKDYRAANQWLGRGLSKSLHRHLRRYPADVSSVADGYYQMLATGRRIDGGEFLWFMRPEVYDALVALNFIAVAEPFSQLPEEIADTDRLLFTEGAVSSIDVNAYERSSEARTACLALHGYRCVCCNIDLQAHYGLERPYIHVHHLDPIAARGGK